MKRIKFILSLFTIGLTFQSFSQSVSLNSPKNCLVTTESSILFNWSKVESATAYQLQIATDSLFSNITTDSLTNNINQLQLLFPSDEYYWHLRSFDGSFSPWSATQKLTVIQLDNIGFLAQHFASDTNIILTAGTVSSWNDISGNNYQAVENNSSSNPLLVNDVLNGYPAVRFDGVDDILLINDSATVGSLFIVANWRGTTPNFQNYSGLFNHQSNPIIFTANINSPELLINFSPYFGSNIYVNTAIQNSLSPIQEFKIICGIKPIPTNISNFVVAQDRNLNNRYWNGDFLEIIMYNDALNDSTRNLIEQYLRFKYVPPVDLGPSIKSACDTSTTLTLPDYFSQILWSTGDTTQSITITQSDTISVQATDIFGFQSSDTIILKNFQNKHSINITNDTISCGMPVIWDTELDSVNYSFLWSNGDTSKTLNITNSSQYYVTVTDTFGCSITSDTINVTIDSLSIQTSLGPDKTVCKGSNIGLTNGGSSDLSYLWSTNDTTSQITINTADTYFIEVTNSNNCIGRDTVIIDTNGIAPTINFTIENLCTNALTQFTNTSYTTDGSNIISEKWHFGDGDSTTTQNPLHQYATNTTYTVTLIVTTDSGCVNTLDSIIQIYTPPTAGFFVSTNPICSESITSFTDNSFSTDGTINSWFWNFGDTGTTDTSSLQHPNYIFPITNIYNVQLITTTQYGCSDTIINPITVKQSPIASFTASNLCLNAGTQFNNTSQGNIFALNWNFGDFNNSTLNNPTNIYANTGSHTVTLAVTAINGCTDTLETIINIAENPIANFDTQDFCAESTNQLFDSSSTNIGSIINWEWNIVNHPNQSNNQNPTFLFTNTDTGYYYLDLIVTTNLGCNDSIRDSINVYPLPVPDFTFTPTTGAPPLSVNFTNLTIGNNQYLWNFGDNSTSTLISPTHIYQDSNNYFIQLNATSVYGCTDSLQKSIYVIDPITDIAISNVEYAFSTNSNFLNIVVQLSNLGTFTITNTDLEIEISGFGTTLEKWVGTLNTGESLNYSLSNAYEVNSQIPDLICVRAINPNGMTDNYSKNNEFCITTNKFQLVSISPNPTSTYINLNYIIPSSGKTTVNLFNASGKKVKNLYTGSLEKGFIRQNFNLATYSNGIYFIEIKFQGNSIKEKILLK